MTDEPRDGLIINCDAAATREMLGILQEECAEVIQIASKILRFGLDGTHGGTLPATRDRLVSELGDLIAMIEIACCQLDITDAELVAACDAKMAKLRLYSNLLLDGGDGSKH